MQYKRLDLVNTQWGQLIITGHKPNSPKYNYIAVKVNGQGGQYKLAGSQITAKIGTVEESHPAVQAVEERPD